MIKNNNAFTLVELAIILIIIGLITGGVVGTNSLIESAKINATITQLNSYNSSFKAFILEYDAIPGDFSEAYDYGLTHLPSGVQIACRTINNNGSGDGDGKIEDRNFSTVMRHQSELINFWVHMQMAGVIDGDFNPYAANENCNHSTQRANRDFPESQGVGETIFVLQDGVDLVFVLGGFKKEQSMTQITSPEGGDNSISLNLLTPKQASKVDRKIDDNKPLQGLVKVASTYSITHTSGDTNYGEITYDPNDSATNCIYNSSYNKAYSENACTLAIKIN